MIIDQEVATQKLRSTASTPLHAITIQSCGPNGESGRNQQAKKSEKSPSEDSWKFRPRMCARSKAKHSWNLLANEQSSNNHSEL